MNDTTFDENRTDAMLLAAEQLNPSRSGQEMVLHSPAAAMPATAAVFAEPIVTAQPCSIRRNIPDFLNRMKVLARMAGEEYRYSFPVKSKSGKNTTVEGGSIKLANDLVREYGNCMVDARVVETPNHFIIYARFVDFETGFCDTRPFMQRKGQKTMNTDADRAADIVFQIGMSKAKRNVVLNALQTYADFTYAEAKSSIVEQIGKQLPHWREKMARGIAEKKYDLARIEQQVGRPLAEWLAVDIARVVAELKSIGDGMASFDDLYPGQNPASSDELNQEFLNGGAEAKPVEPEQQKPTDNTAEHQSMKGGETTTDAARTQAMKEEVERIMSSTQAPAKAEEKKVTTADIPVSKGDPLAERKKSAEKLLEDMQAVETAEERDDLLAKAGGQNLIMALNKDGQYELVKLIKKAAGIA